MGTSWVLLFGSAPTCVQRTGSGSATSRKRGIRPDSNGTRIVTPIERRRGGLAAKPTRHRSALPNQLNNMDSEWDMFENESKVVTEDIELPPSNRQSPTMGILNNITKTIRPGQQIDRQLILDVKTWFIPDQNNTVPKSVM